MPQKKLPVVFPSIAHWKNKSVRNILLLALTVRLLWMIIILLHDQHGFLLADSTGYLNLAKNLHTSGVYSMSDKVPLYPDVFRTPVYPALLWLNYVGGYFIPFIIPLQLILSTLIVFHTRQLLIFFFGEQKWTGFLLLLLVFDIPSIVFANAIMTETLFAFFCSAAAVFLIRFSGEQQQQNLLLSALFFGLAALTRPVGIGLPLFLLPLIWLMLHGAELRKKLSIIFLFSVIYLTTISTWIIRNYYYYEKPFLSYIGSFNLIYFSAAQYESEKQNIHLNTARTQLYEEARHEMNGSPADYPAVFYSSCRKVALRHLLHDPESLFINLIRNEFRCWFHPMSGYIGQQLKTDREKSLLLNALVYFQYLQILTYSLLCATGIFYIFRKQNRMILLLIAGFFCYFFLTAYGPEMEARFRIPVMPVIVLLAALGLQHISLPADKKTNA